MNGSTARTMRHVLIAMLAIAPLLPSGVVAGPPAPEWTWQSPGADADVDFNLFLSDNPRHIAAVDAQGNAFVAATADIVGSDFLTRKYAPDGTLLWSARFDGYGLDDDAVVALALDAEGDVFVTGRTGAGFPSQAAVVKYDGDTGTRLWVRHIGDSLFGFVRPRALAVDAAGDVVMTGVRSYTTSGGDYLTVKYRGHDGASVWTSLPEAAASYDGPAHSTDVATAVAIDGEGDVLVTGYTLLAPNTLAGARFATVKYDGATGESRWTSLPDGAALHGAPAPAQSLPVAIAIDSANEVIVAGDSDSRLTTIKYDGASGGTLWSGLPDGAAVHPDAFFTGGLGAMAIDADDDIVVTGNDGDALTTIKYASQTGATRWNALPQGAAQFAGNATGRTIAIDGEGDVVVGGEVDVGAASDVVVLKYAGDSGGGLWNDLPDGVARIDGPGDDVSGEDAARTVLVDAGGDVRIAGIVRGATNRDLLLARLDGSTGIERWRADDSQATYAGEFVECGPNPQASRTLVVDASGNTYVTGYSGSASGDASRVSGLVYKIATDGQEVWRVRWRDLPDAASYGCGIALDAAGDLIVTGFSGSDLSARKLEADTGDEIWSTVHVAAGVERPGMSVVDADGDVTTTATSTVSSNSSTILVVRYDGETGDVLWSTRRSGSAGTAQACCLVVDANGDVMHAGRAANAGGVQRLFLDRLRDADGSVAWSTGVDTAAVTVVGLARDALGDPVLLSNANVGVQAGTALTVKFDAATGVELWRSFFGLTFAQAAAYGLGIDADGNALVTGEVATAPRNYLTYKLAAATGEPMWTEREAAAAIDDFGSNQEPGRVVLDGGHGVVWSGGFVRDAPVDRSVALLGYGSSDGFTRFRYRYAEPGHDGREQIESMSATSDGALRILVSAGTSEGQRILALRLDPRRAAHWPHLASLVPSAGTLLPASDPFDHVFRIEVAHAIDSLTLAPTATRADAVITLDGAVVGNGASSQALALDVGFNRFALQTTSADDGAERSVYYAVEIVRARLAQNITMIAPATRLLDEGEFAVDVSASSGLPVTVVSITPDTCSVDGTTVQPIAVGPCVLRASQDGDVDHEPAAVERTIDVVSTLALFADGFE